MFPNPVIGYPHPVHVFTPSQLHIFDPDLGGSKLGLSVGQIGKHCSVLQYRKTLHWQLPWKVYSLSLRR